MNLTITAINSQEPAMYTQEGLQYKMHVFLAIRKIIAVQTRKLPSPGRAWSSNYNQIYSLTQAALFISFSSTTFAQDPSKLEFYGRINLAAEVEKLEAADSITRIISNKSRLAFRGETNLGDTVQLIYQGEYQVNIHGRTLTARNSFIGLRGSFGRILAGKHDTPTKLALNGIDLFNDMTGDVKFALDGEVRSRDVLLYQSPSAEKNGFRVAFATVSGGGDAGSYSDFNDGLSASLSYANENFYAAVSVDKDVKQKDLLRSVFKYSTGPLTLGAMFQISEDTKNSRDDENGFFVSATYKVNNFTWKAQFAASDQKVPGAEHLSLGLDYCLGSNTKLFTYYTGRSADDETAEVSFYAVGFEHRF